jgi:peptidyl-dipeptidase Dcp
MPQSAPRLARKLSIMLASTAMMMGYSQMSTAVAAEPAAKTAPAGQNPMLAPWTGPYEGVPPWDKLDPELFPGAFQKAMDEVKAEVQAVIDNPAAPTFDNTHVPMQLAGDTIQRIYALWGVQTSNRSNDRVEAIDAEWSPKLSKFFTELYLDPKLFARYKAVYDARNTSGLDAQQIRIVERSYEEMVRDGANLSPADKAKLVEINSKLFLEAARRRETLYLRHRQGRARRAGARLCRIARRRGDGAGQARPVGDQEHPFFGAARAAERDQPGLARESLARLCRARRQWRRE